MSSAPILAVRSSAPVPAGEAARIAAEVLRPRAERSWIDAAAPRAASAGPAQALETFVALEPRQAPGGCQPDILWVLCQLARFARELRVEFEVELEGLRGRVGTGGLDEGARALLAAERGRPAEIAASTDPAGLRRAQRVSKPAARRLLAHAG